MRFKNFLRSVIYSFIGWEDIAWVLKSLNEARQNTPVKTVFDVGAATGEKTELFLKFFPEALVYAFEPQKEGSQKLKERMKRFKDRVRIFDFGLFNKNGEVFLNIAPYRDASSILPSQNFVEEKKESIKVFKLDDFVKQEKIDQIDFIKIDVEGVEKEILEGGVDTFKNKVDNVFVEILPMRRGINSNHFYNIIEFFRNNGFIFVGHFGDYFFSKDKYFLDNISKEWKKF